MFIHTFQCNVGVCVCLYSVYPFCCFVILFDCTSNAFAALWTDAGWWNRTGVW